jgi:ketosteroid isomerase-like protein
MGEAMTDRAMVSDWVARYERAWRAPGTAALDDLFTDDVTYVRSPWAPAIGGMASLRRFWDAARSGPDEGFRMTSDVVAVDGRTAVVRVAVDYDDGQRWRDLWLLTLDDENRCEHFEEWPFAPDQDDGHRDDD